tara:strand:- start:131 stop:1261 length:1131 start_codon:yes stop_codon:yes gene_type:complete
MGYKPFEWGEQLNPDKLNSKFSQVFSLVTKALAHNKLLKERIKMLSTAFEAVSAIVDTVVDGEDNVSLIYDVPSNYKYYDAGIGDNSYQLFIGGDQLVLDTGPTSVILSGVTSDGLNVILDSVEGEIPVSRIPLVDAPFGEIVPSAGVSVTSNEFKGDLNFILSPTNLWAQKVSVSELLAAGSLGYKGTIEIDVPDTLSPYMNTLVVSPTIGTRYKAYYISGNVWKEITNDYTVGKQTFYLDADLFTGQLLLELVGVEVESEFMSFGLNNIEAYYTKFVDAGLLTATYELGNVETAATITGINTNVEMGDMLQLVVKNSVDEVVYDSELHGFPYPVSGTNSFDLGGKILKYEIHLTKKRDTTPALPFLTFNYKETV